MNRDLKGNCTHINIIAEQRAKVCPELFGPTDCMDFDNTTNKFTSDFHHSPKVYLLKGTRFFFFFKPTKLTMGLLYLEVLHFFSEIPLSKEMTVFEICNIVWNKLEILLFICDNNDNNSSFLLCV